MDLKTRKYINNSSINLPKFSLGLSDVDFMDPEIKQQFADKYAPFKDPSVGIKNKTKRLWGLYWGYSWCN